MPVAHGPDGPAGPHVSADARPVLGHVSVSLTFPKVTTETILLQEPHGGHPHRQR